MHFLTCQHVRYKGKFKAVIQCVEDHSKPMKDVHISTEQLELSYSLSSPSTDYSESLNPLAAGL